MEETFLNFSSIKCRQHPLQIITNFCANEKCMVGLCSLCICTHTQMHLSDTTSPKYRPLKQVHSAAYEQINSWIKMLQNDKNKILTIMKGTIQRKQNFKKVLQSAKNDVLQLVNKVFQQVQKKLQEQVKEEERKTGLHSVCQMESSCRKLNREITQLMNEGQALNSIRFLQTIKLNRNNVLSQALKTHNEVSKQIRQNQQYKPTLDYNKGSLANVEVSVRKLLSLTFFYPQLSTRNPYIQAYKQNMQNIMKSTIIQQQSNTIWPSYPAGPSLKLSTILPVQQNLANSLILNSINNSNSNSRVKQELRHQRGHSNLTKRSNSVNVIQFIPQIIDMNNYTRQIQKKSNGMEEFRLSSSRIFTQARR